MKVQQSNHTGIKCSVKVKLYATPVLIKWMSFLKITFLA